MTIAFKQSPYIPTWATGGTYPVSANPWSGGPLREAPSDPEAAAGVTPGGQLPAQTYNFTHGVSLDQLAGLVDMHALNWPETGSTREDAFAMHSTFTYGTLIASSKIGGPGQNEPYLWVCDQKPTGIPAGTGECARSRDGKHWQVGGAPPSFSGQPVDVLGYDTKAVLLTDDGADCKVWFSGNAASTWNGPFTLPNIGGGNPNYQKVAWINSAARYVAAGAGCIATSSDGGTWTVRTDALGSISPYSVTGIAAPFEDESGVGCLLLRSSGVTYTLDGVTFEDVAVGSTTIVAGCWSEVHSAWFVLDANGQLYRSATVNGSWVQVAALYGPSSSSFTRPGGCSMQAWGKNLVILGDRVRASNSSALRAGRMLVYDPVNAYGVALSPHGGFELDQVFDRLVRHDGRLVAARVSDNTNPFYVELAMSLRAPWVVL